MTSGSVEVFGYHVWYEKFGTGEQPILLIPGAIGTGRTDFGRQIEGSNAFDLKKYTLVCVEPPGWGRSRPPLRTYDQDIYWNDGKCFYEIMQKLGYPIYTVMGWSDGARTALLMAASYPSRIKNCIVWGVVMFFREQDVRSIVMTKNIKFWGQALIDNYEKVYGNEWGVLWTRHMEFLERIPDLFPDGIGKHEIKKIRCPVFVLHGDQDPMVDLEHPTFVTENISDSRMYRFPKGAHNLHYSHASEFKKVVQNFLEETEEYF